VGERHGRTSADGEVRQGPMIDSGSSGHSGVFRHLADGRDAPASVPRADPEASDRPDGTVIDGRSFERGRVAAARCESRCGPSRRGHHRDRRGIPVAAAHQRSARGGAARATGHRRAPSCRGLATPGTAADIAVDPEEFLNVRPTVGVAATISRSLTTSYLHCVRGRTSRDLGLGAQALLTRCISLC
jgi:hypothetical protein